MQAYQGYYENGQFTPVGCVKLPRHARAILVIADDVQPSVQDNENSKRLAALGEFFSAVAASDEDVPEFERVKLTREVNL